MHSRANLDQSLVRGIAWTTVVTWTSQILAWVATFYVVGRLTPSDYGLIAMAAVYFGLVQAISDFGVGAAVLRFRSLDRDQIAQFNTVAVGTGFACLVLSGIAAIPIGLFYNQSGLPAVIVVMSGAYLITGFRVVPTATLQRDLQFKTLAAIDGMQALVMAGSSVLMARAGFGYWTLVLSPVIGAAVGTALVVAQRPISFRRPRLAVIREPLTFGGHMFAARLAWFGFSNADFLIIGKFLGEAAAGVYYTGWYIAGVAVEKVTALIGRVTPAFFSAVQNDHAALRRYLLLLTEGLSVITFPACIGIALVASDIVRALLSDVWLPAIVPIQLLAIVATYRSVQPLFPQFLAAIGEARRNMNNTLLTVAVIPFGFYFASHWGPNGVAAAWVILGPLLFSPLFVVSLRLIGLPKRKYFLALWPATSGCLVMTAAILVADRAILRDVSPLVSLITKIALGVVSYTGTLFALHHRRIFLLRDMIRTLRGGAPAAADPAPR